jgi:hypothetical protein
MASNKGPRTCRLESQAQSERRLVVSSPQGMAVRTSVPRLTESRAALSLLRHVPDMKTFLSQGKRSLVTRKTAPERDLFGPL